MRVSVVIPVFNRANLIGETLSSIAGQTRVPDEIIVVDDGSSDDILAALAPFGNTVRYTRQENKGPAAARNLGLRIASGDAIQFFDSDDLMSPNNIEAKLDALERTGAEVAYGPWAQAELANGQARLRPVVLQQRPLPLEKTALRWYLQGWVTVFQTCVFKRSLLDRAGPYDETLMPTEDSEMLFRILNCSPRLAHTPDALILYRLHAQDQISGGPPNSSLRRAKDWLRYKETVLSRLETDKNAFSHTELIRWRRETDEARDMLNRLEAGGVGESKSTVSFVRDLASRARRRLAGRRFDFCYGEGELSFAQADQIRKLGYEPRMPV